MIFRIKLSPRLSDDGLKLVKAGSTLTINDTSYDFSSLNDGDEIPEQAIIDDNIEAGIIKHGGVVNLIVKMPYSDGDASKEVRFPEPVMMIEDGEITFNQKVSIDD